MRKRTGSGRPLPVAGAASLRGPPTQAGKGFLYGFAADGTRPADRFPQPPFTPRSRQPDPWQARPARVKAIGTGPDMISAANEKPAHLRRIRVVPRALRPVRIPAGQGLAAARRRDNRNDPIQRKHAVDFFVSRALPGKKRAGSIRFPESHWDRISAIRQDSGRKRH